MPRFTIRNIDPTGSSIYIDDDQFGFNARIQITGDWSEIEKLHYAAAVCNLLNGTVVPIKLADDI